MDYGLSYRYAPDSVQKDYKEDPKRCHDGTIEFTSIDAHKGAGWSFLIFHLVNHKILPKFPSVFTTD